MDDFQEDLLEHIPRLRRFARGLTANAADADDLVQGTLERALEKSQQWTPGTNLRAWLLTILYNLFVSDYRRRQTARDWAMTLATYRREANPVQEEQIARLRLKDMEVALQKLPEDQRSIVLLVALEGLSYQETAELLDVPIGTVRSRLSRGRQELRRALNEARESNVTVIKR